MALEYGAFKQGNIRFPLATKVSTNRSNLEDADPVIFHLLEYFEAMIRTHMGERIVEAAAAAGLTNITDCVMGTMPYLPDNFLPLTQFKFPLLAVYRVREEQSTEKTTSFSVMNIATIGVDYIFPPMEPAQMEIIWPLFSAVVKVLHNRSEQGFDPSYTPTGTKVPPYAAGDSPLAAAGLENLMWVSTIYGAWDKGEGLPFMGFRSEIQVREILGQSVEDFDDIEGTDGTIETPGDPGSITDPYELIEVEIDLEE